MTSDSFPKPSPAGRGRPFRRGLVVGKFCPLHRGHMHLIGRAAEACDEILLISYTKPGFPGLDRAVREAWLREAWPAARVLVLDDAWLADACRRRGLPQRSLPFDAEDGAVHRAFTAWLCRAIAGVTVDAVFTSEDYGDALARALTADFREHHPGHAEVRHVCVDRGRSEVPVSGTRVRAAPHAERRYLDPAVYAHYVDRVCLLGGESSGKTTLAQALARRLDTAWAAEVGSEWWERRGGRLDYPDMRSIAVAQVAREDALARTARRWLICDGSALTTLFYSLDGYGRADPEVRRLARRPYAFTFVCVPDFPFVQDGTRRDAAFRERQYRWYRKVLEARGVPYALLEGPVARRVDTACRLLDDGPDQCSIGRNSPGKPALG